MRVLLAEDKSTGILMALFKHERHTVHTVRDRKALFRRLRFEQHPDAVIMDSTVRVEDAEGTEILKRLRMLEHPPYIVRSNDPKGTLKRLLLEFGEFLAEKPPFDKLFKVQK